MKILVVDGQGGRVGRLLIEAIRTSGIVCELAAIGTNSAATVTMLSAKADYGATGENALIVNCRDADYIVGPIGIIVADALHGEVSPAMTVAISQSRAKKILLPVSRCNTEVVGAGDLPLPQMIQQAVDAIRYK